MKKFILINFCLVFFVSLSFSSQRLGYDTVNVRKLFFNNEDKWDSYMGKKNSFFNDAFGTICLTVPPKFFDKKYFEEDLILNLKISKEKKDLIAAYEYKEDIGKYFLKESKTNREKNNLKNILQKIGFKDFDYFLIFYKKDTLLEKRYPNNDENFSSTFTFGKMSYLLDYKKNLREVKVYFQDNNNSYIYFDSDYDRRFDVYLFGKPYKKGLTHTLKFDSLKIIDLDAILAVIEENDIERETLVNKDDKKIKEEFIDEIITPALGFAYVKDGARNHIGEFVYISNGKLQSEKKIGFNCSGFVKEIADNYIRYKKPDFKRLSIEELSIKLSGQREETTYAFYEEKYDPYFGLDWTKNIIEKINEYSGFIEEKAILYTEDEYAPVFENGEYNFKDIKEIIFRDQQKDSNYFYIVVFNKFKVTPPSLPSFYHISIIVPYFEKRHFYLRVFESGVETAFPNLIKKHSGEKIAIFKIPLLF